MTNVLTKKIDLDIERRVRSVDICRSFAILLAMASHTIHWGQLSGTPTGLRFVMQMAPAVFICLFGAMLEFVYTKKILSGNSKGAIRQLFNRAVQCYVLYCISVFALFSSGKYTFVYSIRCILMDGITPYTDILKFYAVALAVAPLLIWIRIRFGLYTILAFAIGVNIAHPIIKTVPALPTIPGTNYFAPLSGFLYGGGHASVGGPSVLHGLTFVAFGIILGAGIDCIMSGKRNRRKTGIFYLALLGGIGVLGSLVSWHWADWRSLLVGIGNLSIRNANRPIYFSLGLSATVILVSTGLLLFDIWQQRWADWLRFLGRVSLFTFCFGNVILYLVTPEPANRLHSSLLAIGLLVIIALQSFVFDRLSRSTPADARPIRVPALAVQKVIATSRRMIGWVSDPAADALSRLLFARSGEGRFDALAARSR